MTDIFAAEGIEPPKDIFSAEGIEPPSLQEQNRHALSPMPLSKAPAYVQQEEADHRSQIEKLASMVFSESEIEDIKSKGKIGFWEAKDFLDVNQVLPGGGIYQAMDSFTLLKAAEKMKNGEETTVNEDATLQKFLKKHVEMNLRGLSVGGGITYYGAQTPAFMVEFAASGGVGKIAQEGAEAGLKKVVNKAVLTKTAGVAANVAARTAVMPQRYIPKYAELRLNDYMAVTDKGSLIFRESEESPAKSALKAFGFTGTEVASELSGAAIGKYLVKPVTSTAARYFKTPIQSGIQRLPIALRQNLYKAYQAINPNARVSKVFSAAGWNGMLEELGEERVADIMNATLNMATDKDFNFQDYMDAITPSSDQLLIEAGIIGITGGVKSSADIAMNILTEKLGGDRSKAQETVDNMSATEQESFINEELSYKGLHRSPNKEGGAPLHELAGDIYPEDIYSPQAVQYYGHGDKKLDQQTIDIVQSMRGNPDAEITIYRAVPKNVDGINDGDWVTINKTYAEQHGESVLDGEFKIVEKTVKAKDIYTNGDSIHEWGYSPERGEINSDPVSQSQMQAAAQQDPPAINNEESGFDRFYRDFVNSLQPIEDITTKAQDRGAQIQPGENPFTLSRTYAGVIGQIEHNLQYGTTRLNPETGRFEVTGKSMKNVLDDFDNSVAHIEGSRDAREQDFNDYLIARRTLEDLVPRDDVEVAEKDKIKSVETMARLEQKYGDEFIWFDTFAQEMYGYQRRVLQNLVDSQVLSQQQYDEILTKNPNYIPFQRVLEEDHFTEAVSSRGVFTDANARKAIKRIQGSDKDIKTTTHSVIANTAKIVDLAYRNRVATGIANLADIMPEYIQPIKPTMKKIVVEGKTETIETYRPSEIAPKNTITAYVDGKKKYYRVSEPLLEAMNNLSPVQMNATFKLLTEPLRFSARLLRAGATLIPEFWIRNVIRDQGTALLQSPVRPTPIDMVQGLTAVIGKNELYQDWMRNGGAFNSYMELDDKGLEKAYRELFRPQGKFARYARNPINLLEDISMALEKGTRIGAFKKARQQGIQGVEAALLAREATLDFARGGVVARNINQYIPFFNAGVQSVDKLARTFKENPKATALWGLASITVPSVLLTGYYLYGAPEDERQEYLEIPQWQRDMFWVFKENGQWRRIPKPFSFGYLFGSVPERFMIWGYEGDKPEIRDFWKELALGIGGTISPVYDPSAMLPPLVKVAIENLTNYNFFTGRNIYPEWMDRFEPEQRKNKYTSETAVALGEQLGVSPALLDNSLRGQLAGSATYVTDAGDWILKQVKQWNGEEVPSEPVTPADTPVIKAFSVREPTGYGTNSVSNFFDNWNKVQQKHATYNKLEGEEKMKYREKNSEMLRRYKPMKKFYERIRVFGKQSDRIYEDPDMTPQEKVKALSENGDKILDTAKEANQWFNDSSVN